VSVYYAAFDSTDTPVGVYRFLVNDEAQTLDLERLTDQGTWADDPEAIAELREPEVRRLEPDEVSEVLAELGARRDAETEADAPPDLDGGVADGTDGATAPARQRGTAVPVPPGQAR
jgi:hypothetical protein